MDWTKEETMTRDEVIAYYRARLKDAHKELNDFEACVAKYNLRILHRTSQEPERDETDQHRKWLKNAVDEYQRMLRFCCGDEEERPQEEQD